MKEILNNLLKKKREKIGISQRELARRINVDNATISKIENGNIEKPSFEILFKISKELKIPLFELLKHYNYGDIEKMMYSSRFEEINNTKILEGINNDIINNVTSIKDERIFIDIVKVLKEYKKDTINEEETIKLITACNPIDLDNELIYESEKYDIIINLNKN